jgi:AbiJ N-terminal domain 3
MAADLHGLLAGVLQEMSHAELSEAPRRIAGLVVPNGEDLSKRQRIELALDKLTQEELARLALMFAAHRGDIALDEAGRKVLEASDPPLTHITRRDVARVFGDDLAGERGTVEMVERLFVLSTPFEEMFGSGGPTLRDRIGRHMDRNPGDWSVEFLFSEIGAFDCSRARFAALLEGAVHPLAR